MGFSVVKMVFDPHEKFIGQTHFKHLKRVARISLGVGGHLCSPDSGSVGPGKSSAWATGPSKGRSWAQSIGIIKVPWARDLSKGLSKAGPEPPSR